MNYPYTHNISQNCTIIFNVVALTKNGDITCQGDFATFEKTYSGEEIRFDIDVKHNEIIYEFFIGTVGDEYGINSLIEKFICGKIKYLDVETDDEYGGGLGISIDADFLRIGSEFKHGGFSTKLPLYFINDNSK